MKQIIVHVRERDKKSKALSLFNLRDEIVNFLYRDTVAHSTKADLQFYVLIFFAAIRIDGKSLLERILDEGIPKLNDLNTAFAQKPGYLRAREYRSMVEEHGLTELFENDLFFVIIGAVLNIGVIEERFATFLNANPDVSTTLRTAGAKYGSTLRSGVSRFSASRIQDDRYDDNGNYHDLSKSVYRTVQMRSSRNLDLNLQKYTSIQVITSQSPIDLTFIQYVDPEIIFDLWTKYHVAHYMESIWAAANSSPIIANSLSNLISGYIGWQLADGRAKRKEKEAAKQKFDEEKNKHGGQLDELTVRLVDSVLKANERLEKNIEEKNGELQRANAKAEQDKEVIKRLQEQIARLENLEVDAKVVDDATPLQVTPKGEVNLL